MDQKSKYEELISITLPFPPHLIPIDIPIKKLKQDQQFSLEINGIKIELKQNEQQQQIQKQVLIEHGDDKVNIVGEICEQWEYQGLQDMEWKAQDNVEQIVDTIYIHEQSKNNYNHLFQKQDDSNNIEQNHNQNQQIQLQQCIDQFRTSYLIRPCYSSICTNNFVQPEEHKQTTAICKVDQEEDQNDFMYQILDSLFQQKKVWIRQHMEQRVMEIMQQQKLKFKRILFKKQISIFYSINNNQYFRLLGLISQDHKYGPWKNCYVHNSYDPTKFIDAVKYQTIALKSNSVSDFNELKPKIIVQQLQEIKHPLVQQLIDQSMNREQNFHKKWGWLKDKEYFTIYKTIKSQHTNNKYDLIKAIIYPPIQ